MDKHKYYNQDMIDVFLDTRKLSKLIDDNESETTKHTFSDIINPEGISEKYNIKVINTDSVSALQECKGKSCILNMASYKRPGGGVENGSKAQEESLFRCSNLFEIISKEFYPLNHNECLYTKNAIFFKDFHYNIMDNFITSDVVTMAAVNLNQQEVSNYEELTKNKIRLILSLAGQNSVNNIILGAWGCGVFKNDPRIISKYFKNILIDENYSSMFRNVLFPVINDHNSAGNNYSIFKTVLSDKQEA